MSKHFKLLLLHQRKHVTDVDFSEFVCLFLCMSICEDGFHRRLRIGVFAFVRV